MERTSCDEGARAARCERRVRFEGRARQGGEGMNPAFNVQDPKVTLQQLHRRIPPQNEELASVRCNSMACDLTASDRRQSRPRSPTSAPRARTEVGGGQDETLQDGRGRCTGALEDVWDRGLHPRLRPSPAFRVEHVHVTQQMLPSCPMHAPDSGPLRQSEQGARDAPPIAREHQRCSSAPQPHM